MTAVLIHPPAHLERAFGRGVLGGIVDQVGKRRVDLRLIADQPGVGVDAHPHLARVDRARQGVLAQQREQRRDIDRLTADDLVGFLEPRQLEQIADDGGHALRLAAHFSNRSVHIGIERRILAESLQVT